MFLYLTVENVLTQLEFAGHPAEVRDWGLLEAAVTRPRASAGQQDAYPSLHDKAAALLHSLARTQGLVDGNKRAALLATKAMLDINGWVLEADDMELYWFVVEVAEGKLDDVPKIAELLRRMSRRSEYPPDLLG